MARQTVAVIGLGQMGSAVALNLREKGFDVRGWDVAPAVRERVASLGISIGETLAATLKGRRFVLTSLPNGDIVRASWSGKDGIVELADPESTLIDLSTIEPSVMREVADCASARGLKVLDCPVSGGPVEARAGTLIVMAGGDTSVIEHASSVLEALGPICRHTGDVGTAKVVKIVNNTMAMGNLLVACEAFSLGEALGVDSATLFDVLAESGGRSMTFLKRFPPALQGDFDARFKLALAEKDLALSLAMARELGVQTPAATLVREIFAQALAEGYGDRDAVALLAMCRSRIQKQTRN